MCTNLLKLIRIAGVALALAFATAPFAEAGSSTARSEAPRRATQLWGLPRDHPAIAIGAIAGGIALIVFFAWLAVRIGDKGQ